MTDFQKIKKGIEDNGYMFFTTKNYNLNIIFERTSNEITNRFTDKCHILYYVNGVETYKCSPCTTKPGIKGSIDSPITYEGITGTSIIIPNQYRGTWQYNPGIATKKYPWNVPFLEQVKPISYWRDGDRDLVIDEVQRQDNKIFGTHIHAMSQKGVTGYSIDNWSLGCMGMEEPYMTEFMKIVKSSVALWGVRFTVTLIETEKLFGNLS